MSYSKIYPPFPRLGSGFAGGRRQGETGLSATVLAPAEVLNRLITVLLNLDLDGLPFGDLAHRVLEWAFWKRLDILLETLEDVVREGEIHACTEVSRQLVMHLEETNQQVPAKVIDALLPWFFALMMVLEDHPVAQRLAAVIAQVDTRDDTHEILRMVGLLCRGNAALRKREYGEAIRAGWAISGSTNAHPELVAEALAIRALGYAGQNETVLQYEEIQAWDRVFVEQGCVDGAVEFAVKMANASGNSGLTSKGRTDRFLQLSSMLAELHGRFGDHHRERATLERFVRHGYPDWEDTERPGSGTIRDRLRHGTVEAIPVLAERSSRKDQLTLIRPDRVGEHVSRDDAEMSVAVLFSDGGAAKAIDLAALKIVECCFPTVPADGSVTTDLRQSIVETSAGNGFTRLGLTAKEVSVVLGHPANGGEPWIVLRHGVTDHNLEGIAFGIRPVVVGEQLQVDARALYVPSWRELPITRNQVVDLLVGHLDEVPGYQALATQVVDMVVSAAKRLSNSTG